MTSAAATTATPSPPALSRVRRRQWMYLGPILAAPIAHIAVTLHRDAQSARRRRALVVFGVVGATVATVVGRVALMCHAGYVGGGGSTGGGTRLAAERTLLVNDEERRHIEAPSLVGVVKEMLRGFV